REAYYPLEVYCEKCGRDSAKTKSYDKEKTTITYVCQKCGHEGSYNIMPGFKGKLIWKANWALRWSDDSVNFESSGENQLTDTGSYSVATRIAAEIFGGKTPFHFYIALSVYLESLRCPVPLVNVPLHPDSVTCLSLRSYDGCW
ncbi:MAG: hypothetical protein J6W60_09420, partial [Treponema sp.]|nr:hypothetical protein [Treponema sp.]